MPTLQLYNPLSRQVEPFAAIDEESKSVTFYSCGPTVYDYSHIGNFRSFLNADLLRRTLELFGYHVRHVMNMTDVGHMTDDELADGGGEDKMAAAARRLQQQRESGSLGEAAKAIDPADPTTIAEYYIRAFQGDARTLGVKVALEAIDEPALMPRPTQYVRQMIDMIERLIARGHAYVASDGAVYFDVQSFPAYGKLSGNTPDRIRAGEGGRVHADTQQHKKHPADFLLWKPDPHHLMRWPSPWGEGYPGWHLECSVMAASLLGEEIDIHSGGEDNIFPHHECEIAQTCGATGQDRFARFWFHTRHLMVEGEKMSKSLGNFFTVRDLLARGGTPAAIRLALTSTHYRANANFTMQGLRDAQRRVDRWMRALADLRENVNGPEDAAHKGNPRGVMSDARDRFTEALADDLNISSAMAAIDEAVAAIEPGGGVAKSDVEALETMLRTIGVLELAWQVSNDDDADASAINARIAERNDAREQRDWAAADRIRDELLAAGIAIKDGPEGTTWERVVQ